jgi:hypothetical protein
MGIQIAKKEQKLGIRASSTCTLNFDDLKIPAENVIGGEGRGYKVTCPSSIFYNHSLKPTFRLPLKFSMKVIYSTW